MKTHNSTHIITIAVAFQLLLTCFSPAVAAPPRVLNEYAVFAGHQITFNTSFNPVSNPNGNGIIGSNGDITGSTGATLRANQVEAGGSLLGDPHFMFLTKNLLINGAATFGGLSQIDGTVDISGIASIDGTVLGNIKTGGNTTLTSGANVSANLSSNGSVTMQNSATVAGNLIARNNVTLQGSNTVSGNVTYGGTLSIGSFSSIAGATTNALTTTAPDFYSPVTIPTASFTAAGADISVPTFGNVTIAPGTYGDLNFASSATVHFSPGKYYFDSMIAPSGFTTIDYNLTQPGAIEIYIVGDFNIPLQIPRINGSALSSTANPLASRVLIESLGNITTGRDAVGTLFAPFGNVTTNTSTRLWGAIIAGNDVALGATTVNYVPYFTTIPEPSTWVLMLFGTVGVGYVARRKRKAA